MVQRIGLFIVLAVGLLFLYQALLPPPRPQPGANNQQQAAGDGQPQADQGQPRANDAQAGAADPEADPEPLVAPDPTPVAPPPVARPTQRIALGSLDPESGYALLVVLTSDGAALLSAELSDPAYRDQEAQLANRGYLGLLWPETDPQGARITVVGHGTPAAKAGLQPGDVVTRVYPAEGAPIDIRDAEQFMLLFGGHYVRGASERLLPEQRRFRPGDRIRLAIVRGEEKREVSAVLEHFPLAIIRPELANFALAEDPLSLLCTLQEIQRPAAADAAGDPEVLARIGTDLGIKMRSPDTGYGVVITEFSEPRQQNLMWRHGFAVNDVIYNIDGQDVEDPAQLIELLDRMPSGAQLDVAYLRGGQKLRKVVTLPAEIRGLALRTVSWDVQHDAAQGVAEFRYRLDRTVDPGIDPAADGLEIVKRFVLPRRAAGQSAHHVRVELEIINHGAPRAVSYQLDGPNGLPVEGWWYTYKIGRRWGAAGIRDVAIYFRDDGPDVIGAPALVDGAEDDGVKSKDQPLRYAGVDARYFAAALVPQKPEGAADDIWLRRAIPIRVGLAPPRPHVKLTNTSVRLISRPYVLQPGEEHKLRHTYRLFLGPKRPELLAAEDPSGHLSELVYYGWFGWVSRPLVLLLHFFYGIVANYGLAIILLTVVVRACMLPLGIKQAQSAAKMQELQPEIRRINEKYKNNPEARMRATRELFQKHNYNPFGGCLLLFIQLPIFLGLYRALMIDVELRQAPLVPGLSWCGNLAAPDMLFNWEAFMPAFLADETGWLGPYFNVLPILTIVIFLIHQKMFMPPPADEQAASQQRLMKWMMILFAFMFFCVPSGLCIYFIASSLWGIAERKLIPKHAPVTAAPGATTRVSALEQRRQELREKQQREQGGDGRQKSTRDNKRRPPKAGRK